METSFEKKLDGEWNKSGLQFSDISTELSRTYMFSDGSVTVDEPLYINVSSSGGHRIVTADGTGVYIPKGWLKLSWITKPGNPIFVK